jgi:hypothetical protein
LSDQPRAGIVVHYTPPVPRGDEIANLHDLFHANGHLIAMHRRMGDAAEADRIEAENEALAAKIDALNAEIDKP